MRLLWACTALIAAFGPTTKASPADASSTASAAAIIASDQAALPLCALACIETIIPQYCDALTNITCVCTTSELTLELEECLATKCTVKESLLAERFQKAFCGVPVRNLSATTRKIFWPFFGLAILAVAFRFWARTRRMDGAGLGLDDWTILGSLVLLTAGNAILDQMTRYGLGQDMWMLPPAHITHVLFLFWVQEFIYNGVIMLTKISILFLYLRIFTCVEGVREHIVRRIVAEKVI